MGTETPNSSSQYQQVTVDVPEDRVAEFHAFFARFLAGRGARKHGRGRHGARGRGCGHRHAGRETSEGVVAGQPTEITEA